MIDVVVVVVDVVVVVVDVVVVVVDMVVVVVDVVIVVVDVVVVVGHDRRVVMCLMSVLSTQEDLSPGGDGCRSACW